MIVTSKSASASASAGINGSFSSGASGSSAYAGGLESMIAVRVGDSIMARDDMT